MSDKRRFSLVRHELQYNVVEFATACHVKLGTGYCASSVAVMDR